MSKSICLYFQIHQPARLRLYRFFDIGKDSHYYDDFANRTILKRVVQRCYLPMNELLYEMLQKYKGAFKLSFSISGSALSQFERYAPEVLSSFKKLADTGYVEFLAETYNHSLASLASDIEFDNQVRKHKEAIENYFGVTPRTFRNTELIYSNSIGASVYKMGFKSILTEGARHIMAWRSPNYLYFNPQSPKQTVFLRNYQLSDDIAFRFSDKNWADWPLTGEKYLDWLKDAVKDGGDTINLFMDYETFGEHQAESSGIFDFMRYFPEVVINDGSFSFNTPSEIAKMYNPIAEIDVPQTISWADEERDVTAWLGNELQQDAFNKLYAQYEKLALLGDSALWEDFGHLQESDHFYYMCTKFFSDGEVHKYFNPYDTPYEAFINYMNVLSDFILRINDEISLLDTKFAVEKKDVVVQTVEKTVKSAVKKTRTTATKKTAAKKPKLVAEKKVSSKKIKKTEKAK